MIVILNGSLFFQFVFLFVIILTKELKVNNFVLCLFCWVMKSPGLDLRGDTSSPTREAMVYVRGLHM